MRTSHDIFNATNFNISLDLPKRLFSATSFECYKFEMVALRNEWSISWDDATWILTSSFIVFTMQTGFSLLESGCVQRKNEVSYYYCMYLM